MGRSGYQVADGITPGELLYPECVECIEPYTAYNPPLSALWVFNRGTSHLRK